ncbi:MAG: Flp family type IVb pilin [Planctomycetes bacterium]|nr:Flp family type IVb pilin [Planctomycetota bacterium]
MRVFHRILTRLFSRRDEGAAVAEYAVALLLIVVLTIAIISLLGGSISSFFESASNTI